MYDNVLAVIPARKGSKRFPGKNTALFQGIPLVTNTIRIAKAAGIGKILVTTNDDDVTSIAKSEWVRCLERPDYLCTEDATTEDAVEHAVRCAAGEEIDTICLMQVTSPMLHHTTLRTALENYVATKVKSLIAVNHHYDPCGAFYIFDRELFMQNKSRYQEGGSVCILPAEQCIDVDYEHNLQICKAVRSTSNVGSDTSSSSNQTL